MCLNGAWGSLGFRNIYAFNLTMIGKQGWRFISKPNALSTRVFKAKYFPKRDFMGVGLGNNHHILSGEAYCFPK